MLKQLRRKLEAWPADDELPLRTLLWRYVKAAWRDFVWHVRSEWLHVDPFDHSDAMWEEDDDAPPDPSWDYADDDYPGADYIEAQWDFDDYGEED